MSKEMFNIVSDYKSVNDSSERYVIAAMYLLFLGHGRTLDEIESINFGVHEIQKSIGIGFGWGINTQISDFIKKYRAK